MCVCVHTQYVLVILFFIARKKKKKLKKKNFFKKKNKLVINNEKRIKKFVIIIAFAIFLPSRTKGLATMKKKETILVLLTYYNLYFN